MLHPSTAAEPTDTLEHAFALAGKTKVDNILNPETGEYGSFYKMQDMTTNICESTSLVDEQNTLQLVDIRDNKLYWVTKLRDGHCWMTQNLDLDLSSSIALTSETTDLNDNSLVGAYQEGYSYDTEHGIISWSPKNTTKIYDTSTGAWNNSVNVAYSLNPGKWYWNGNDNTPNCNYLTTTCEDFSQTPFSNNSAHGAVGNYYNWSAAIASDDSSSLTSNTYDDITKNPQNSICPKGWRLPTISNMAHNIVYSTSEFGRLNYLYNENKAGTDLAWIGSPLWFVRSGYYAPFASGHLGNYWANTIYSGSGAYSFFFSKQGVDPASLPFYGAAGNRVMGRSVRCIAR